MKKVLSLLPAISIMLFLFLPVCITAGEINTGKKDIHYFIDRGWDHHSSIKQAEHDVRKYKFLELEAWSVYTPKIKGMTWLAPMYSIEDSGTYNRTDIDFNNWGPYYHMDMQFQQPLFAFTRVISGIKAARAGQDVARADVEITRWQVAKEIRTYYYGIVFANTLLKTIDMADEMLNNAYQSAETSLEEGGDVSEVDLIKLKYYMTQIPVYRSFAEKSMEMAQEALELSTGSRLEPQDIPRRLVMEKIELKETDEYQDLMFTNRPLYKKLKSGINATRELMNLEYKAMIPVLFAGGFIKFNAASTVDMHYSKYLSNEYNTFTPDGRGLDGGFAVGFVWDFDPMKAISRGLQKKAELDKLVELQNYAIEGFPVELAKVLSDMTDLRVKAENQKEAVSHAQSWMFFAANAYAMGDGDAKDVMDGLAAYIQAKMGYYQALYDYNQMIGDLCSIVGTDVTVSDENSAK
jgi:outer membrane protein TolC